MVADPDHRRDRQRGRAGRPDPAPPDRPQDDRPEPAPAAQRRDLRPRADPRPAPGPDRRHRHGRLDALRRELPLDDLPPDLRRDRASRACGTSSRGLETAVRDGVEPRGPLGDDDGGAAGRDQLPQGARRRPLALARPRAPRGGSITGRSTRSCCPTPCGSTARPPSRGWPSWPPGSAWAGAATGPGT